MQLTPAYRIDIVKGYCILFYVLMLHKLWHGFTLFQLQPSLFNSRFDLFTWLIMKTGIHQWLLNNPTGWILFDVTFYAMPLVYWYFFYKKKTRLAFCSAVAMLLVNWVYVQCYTLYPANSIESYTAWLLFPFLFITINLQSFYFVFQGLRYFFLFFFASAGIWKIVQGSIFNVEQMSGILLVQHKEYLIDANNFFSYAMYWLIEHPVVAFSLFVISTILELSFVIGFFTKKYDRILLLMFLFFLLADVFFMRIPYWEVSPFLLTLLYSKHSIR